MDFKLKGTFKEVFNSYIKYKRAKGYKNIPLSKIEKLHDYLNKQKINTVQISEEVYQNFIYLYNDENSIYNNYNTIRDFCQFLIQSGYTDIFINKMHFAPKAKYHPYILTASEMDDIFNFVDSCDHKYKLILPVLFRLLYSSGLRISEALRIRASDVDLQKGSIKIMLSKNNISRQIILSDSMLKVLKNYMLLVNKEYLFPISYAKVTQFFTRMINQMNFKSSIRLHDLRHTMAITTFDLLINKGWNYDEVLFYLKEYLGHSSFVATEYYLHLTNNKREEILQTMKEISEKLYPSVGGCNE